MRRIDPECAARREARSLRSLEAYLYNAGWDVWGHGEYANPSRDPSRSSARSQSRYARRVGTRSSEASRTPASLAADPRLLDFFLGWLPRTWAAERGRAWGLWGRGVVRPARANSSRLSELGGSLVGMMVPDGGSGDGDVQTRRRRFWRRARRGSFSKDDVESGYTIQGRAESLVNCAEMLKPPH